MPHANEPFLRFVFLDRYTCWDTARTTCEGLDTEFKVVLAGVPACLTYWLLNIHTPYPTTWTTITRRQRSALLYSKFNFVVPAAVHRHDETFHVTLSPCWPLWPCSGFERTHPGAGGRSGCQGLPAGMRGAAVASKARPRCLGMRVVGHFCVQLPAGVFVLLVVLHYGV